jgi:hypothetical protein
MAKGSHISRESFDWVLIDAHHRLFKEWITQSQLEHIPVENILLELIQLTKLDHLLYYYINAMTLILFVLV